MSTSLGRTCHYICTTRVVEYKIFFFLVAFVLTYIKLYCLRLAKLASMVEVSYKLYSRVTFSKIRSH